MLSIRSLIFSYAAIVFAAIGLIAQAPTTPAEAARQERERNRQQVEDLDQRMENMRLLDQKLRTLSQAESRSMDQPKLDKKERERVKQMRMINGEHVRAFDTLLQDPRNGVVKIFPNFDCVTSKTIRVDGQCADFVPESSDFSFRHKAYTTFLYHDIGYEKDLLISRGFFSQGMIVSLGDVDIAGVGLESAGVKYLASIVPATSPNEAKAAIAKFAVGFEADGKTFRDGVEAAENTVYAVRVIAYKLGNTLSPPTQSTSMEEMKLLSLNYDKRDDIIVVFRVVRKEKNGGLTVVWRELQRKEAPKLKFGKGETIGDLRPQK